MFAFARVPILVYLGTKLGDHTPVDIYQRDRVRQDWIWPANDGELEFTVDVPATDTAPTEAILIVNVSGTIDPTELPAELADLPVLTLTAADRHPNVIDSPTKLADFTRACHQLIGQIEANGYKTVDCLHVFAATGVACSVELGRVFDDDVHPPSPSTTAKPERATSSAWTSATANPSLPLQENQMTMTPNRNTTDNPLTELLANAARELDLPPEMRAEIYDIYDRAGTYLSEYLDDSADWQVYSQGSIRIGTVVRPSADADYDLDAVVRWNKRKQQLTQADLKSGVGAVIHGFARSEARQPSPPTGCDEGARCWTVNYPGLHVDLLPAIPDDDSSSESGILLTDRKLTRWQFGDPIAYADWFHQQTMEFELRKVELAHKASVDVEDIPDSEVRTTLHRLAQVLKIHRNEWFAADTTNQPPSIIITHLAAVSYSGGSLIDEFADAAARMPSFISRGTDGGWILENPVQPKENFADRWDDARQIAFDSWINRLRRDINDLDALPTGLDGLVHRLGESFGHDTITKAAARLEAAVLPSQSDTGKDFLSRLHGGDAITTSGKVSAMSSTPPTRAWRP